MAARNCSVKTNLCLVPVFLICSHSCGALAADEIAHGILVVPEMLGVLKVKFHREVKTWPVCVLVVVTSTPGANPSGVNAMWVLGCLGAYSHSYLLVALAVLQKQQNQAGHGYIYFPKIGYRPQK